MDSITFYNVAASTVLLEGIILFVLMQKWKKDQRKALCSKHMPSLEQGRFDCHECGGEFHKWQIGLLENLKATNVKFYEGSIFYWDYEGRETSQVRDEAAAAHGWISKPRSCNVHKSSSTECCCIRYYKTLQRGEFPVFFVVLLDNQNFQPKELSFHIDIATGQDFDIKRWEGSEGVSNPDHFKEAFRYFLNQADNLIAQHGIPGMGWLNGSVKIYTRNDSCTPANIIARTNVHFIEKNLK